jgi:quercetin dioxygenase-like cupin family protein
MMQIIEQPTVKLGEHDKVLALEAALLAMPQADMPVRHHFAHKTYGRELFIAKGVTLTGKIHKYSQINVLVSGDISVLTDEGVKRVQPPFIIVSPAGTKRAAYAHEDSIWLTVHGTDKTDVDEIENEFIAQTEVEYLEFCALQEKQLCLG